MHKVALQTKCCFRRLGLRSNRIPAIWTRQYQVDTAHVQVGSSGSIELQIYQPPHPQSTPPNRLLIYFPRGPIPHTQSQSQAPSPSAHSLSIGSNIPVISLNYRLSPSYRFPKAVFDVSTAFEWIKTHFLHYATASPSPGTRIPVTRAHEQIPRVGVAGEFVGGSLAAMLALTECHLYSTHVGAMVLGNPIVDWTAVYRADKRSEDGKAKKHDVSSWNEYALSDELSASDLLKSRRELFASPEAYFDPFVSPLLFFKTPASEVQSYDILAPKVPLSSKENDEFEAFEKFNSDPETMEFLVKRRAHRRYPPLDSEMRLPKTRIELGRESLIADQGRDLGEVIARSVEKHEIGGEGRGARRVEVVQEKDGLGAWDDADLERVGHWFARNLG